MPREPAHLRVGGCVAASAPSIVCGPVGAWPHSSGCLVAWASGCLVAWASGCLATFFWVPGCVLAGTWQAPGRGVPCGCMAVVCLAAAWQRRALEVHGRKVAGVGPWPQCRWDGPRCRWDGPRCRWGVALRRLTDTDSAYRRVTRAWLSSSGCLVACPPVYGKRLAEMCPTDARHGCGVGIPWRECGLATAWMRAFYSADVAFSGRGCGLFTAQMWAFRSADVGFSQRRCGHFTAQMWAFRSTGAGISWTLAPHSMDLSICPGMDLTQHVNVAWAWASTSWHVMSKELWAAAVASSRGAYVPRISASSRMGVGIDLMAHKGASTSSHAKEHQPHGTQRSINLMARKGASTSWHATSKRSCGRWPWYARPA